MDNQKQTALPIAEWTEDDGNCLWWSFPVEEPPYSGTPHDEDFPDYVTHFTRYAVPVEPGSTDNESNSLEMLYDYETLRKIYEEFVKNGENKDKAYHPSATFTPKWRP